MDKGHEVRVLDDGFVRFVRAFGTDEDIVETARVSTGRGFVSWEPYKRCKKCSLVAPATWGATYDPVACEGMVKHDWQDFPRGDLGILDYMMANRHTSPFEFCELVVHVRIPMDAWRQMVRHRTASISEYSTRYSEAIDSMAVTAPDKWRTQGTTNRQGSGAYLPVGSALAERDGMGNLTNPEDIQRGAWLTRREGEFHKYAREVYEERLEAGVAREQARKDLPLSTMTEAFWKIDLHNLMHFLSLRLDAHAQEEIRAYANVIHGIAAACWPRTMALFDEHVLGGVRLSRTEATVLRAFFSQPLDAGASLADVCRASGVSDAQWKALITKLGSER